MLRMMRMASLVILLPAMATAEDQWQRIEDFRSDLTPEEQAIGLAFRTQALAAEAYLWGIPPFMHFRQATEFKSVREMLAPDEEPFGGWILVRNLSDPSVDNAMPNSDTLYGASYVHLGLQGPVAISLPPMTDRYHSVAIHDAYFSFVAILGTPLDGGQGGRYLLLPPGSDPDAPVPEGFAGLIVAPTPVVAVFQRIYVRDATDVEAVRALQDEIQLYPADGAPGDPFPRINTPEFSPDVRVRDTRDPVEYFRFVNAYTGLNPPGPGNETLMASFAEVGLGPAADLPDDPALQAALRDGALAAQVALDGAITEGPFRDGWRIPDPLGALSGPHILNQAVLQITQIGTLPLQQVAYFVGRRDGDGELLTGANSYALTFPAGQLPPIDPQAFWSVTMYKASDTRLYDNEIDRYIIRPSTPGLTYGEDGSLTIHMSHSRPKDVPEGNWLPAPADGFVVAIRAYMPQEPILTGAWFPPAITKVE